MTSCLGGQPLVAGGTVSIAGGAVSADVASPGITYYDANGRIVPTVTAGTVPADAASVRGIPVTASVGQWNLRDASGTISGRCTPSAPEQPAP